MITVHCSCGKSYDVPDEWAGKSAKCKCGKQINVTALVKEPPQPPQPQPASVGKIGIAFGIFVVIVIVFTLAIGGCFMLLGGGEAVRTARQAAKNCAEEKALKLSKIKAEDLPVLDKEFFGFRLGESIDSILQRVDFKSSAYDDPKGYRTVMDRYVGYIVNASEKRCVSAECFHDRLCELTVLVNEDSISAFDTLADQLAKKYGKTGM